MQRIISMSLIGFFLILLVACNGESTKKEVDYEATKKMVVDILQTEEGKKVLKEMLADEKMKEQLVIESDVVKESINHAFASEKGAEMWEKLFKDPKFVEGFAKSMEKEQKKVMKDLLKDPDYQKEIFELLKDPEVTKQVLQLLKSQEFRSHLQKAIQEALDNPIFQAKMQETLLKAAEKQGKEQEGKSQEGKGENSGEQGGGGQGGSGGSGGSGGM